MLDVISVDNMRRSDANTIASFVPSKELMWRASNGIYEESLKENPDCFSGNTFIVVGSGNNGGDGFGLAVVLKNHGISNVRIISVTDHYSEDASYYMNKAQELGIETISFIPGSNSFKDADTIVDCLLGTGFKGEVRGTYKDAILEINSSNAFVISADINSGLDGDSGESLLAIKSDLTVTIGYHKRGILLARKSEYIKSVRLTEIGIVLDKKEDFLLTNDEWKGMGFGDMPYVTKDGVTYFREEL